MKARKRGGYSTVTEARREVNREIDDAKHSKAEYTKAYIEQAYKFDLSEEFFKRLKIFQKYQPEIHGSGCPVCEKLNRALCGLETEVHDESTP